MQMTIHFARGSLCKWRYTLQEVPFANDDSLCKWFPMQMTIYFDRGSLRTRVIFTHPLRYSRIGKRHSYSEMLFDSQQQHQHHQQQQQQHQHPLCIRPLGALHWRGFRQSVILFWSQATSQLNLYSLNLRIYQLIKWIRNKQIPTQALSHPLSRLL